MEPVESVDPLIGTFLGNYRVLERLGSGGMGAVYLGEHKLMKRRAALKVLQPRYSAENEIVERFFKEAKAATSINDPGIVQVFDCDYDNGRPYIAMERLEGEGLDMRLTRRGRLPVHEALRLGRQIAKSLAAAHGNGVIHRDLKPANIYLVHDSEVSSGERSKILDFGIAKLLDDSAVNKTEIGTVMGTPPYMSPEQWRASAEIDHRSDIYSLGCVLFHMLTGEPPFRGTTRQDFLTAHLHRPAPRPSSIIATIPREVDELVQRCLEKHPIDRYLTMAELAAAMKLLLAQLPVDLLATPDDGLAAVLVPANAADLLDFAPTIALRPAPDSPAQVDPAHGPGGGDDPSSTDPQVPSFATSLERPAPTDRAPIPPAEPSAPPPRAPAPSPVPPGSVEPSTPEPVPPAPSSTKPRALEPSPPVPRSAEPIPTAPAPQAAPARNRSAPWPRTVISVLALIVLSAAALTIWRLRPAPRLHLAVPEASLAGQVGIAMNAPIAVEPAQASGMVRLTVQVGPDAAPGSVVDGPPWRFAWTPERAGTFTFALLARADGYPDERLPLTVQIAQAPPPDLVLAGSNTIGGIDAATGTGLARNLVIEFLREKYKLTNISPEEKEIAVKGEDEKDRSMTFRLPEGKFVRVLIKPHGSYTAVTGLRSSDPDAAADIGMSSYPQPELQGSDFVESVLALDAVAVIVHQQNPIGELTLEQLKAIFGPSPVTDWGVLPHAIQGPIHTYGRDEKSGTAAFFRDRTGIDPPPATAGQKTKDPAPYSGPAQGALGHEGYEDTQKVIDSVSHDPQAIGYIGRAAIPQSNVNVVSIRPAGDYSAFRPARAFIATMEYAMTRELYLYRRAGNARPLAAEFVKFCLSDQGQEVVNDAGFVGFRAGELVEQQFDLGNRAPPALKRKVANYDRVRAIFRFKSNSDQLDTISEQNLNLLLPLLKNAGRRRLFIVGSTDSTGSKAENLKLSKERASKFKTELEHRGVSNEIETEGYGKDYLQYNDRGNSKSLEAQRNRRVEIYIERAPQR